MAHTPGPWEVFDPEQPWATFGIDSKNGDAVVYYGNSQSDGIPEKDDARLIAAAPDLLEALKKLASIDFGSHGWDEFAENAAREARAAIAKATGEK